MKLILHICWHGKALQIHCNGKLRILFRLNRRGICKKNQQSVFPLNITWNLAISSNHKISVTCDSKGESERYQMLDGGERYEIVERMRADDEILGGLEADGGGEIGDGQ